MKGARPKVTIATKEMKCIIEGMHSKRSRSIARQKNAPSNIVHISVKKENVISHHQVPTVKIKQPS
jgi:hypothetical protein